MAEMESVAVTIDGRQFQLVRDFALPGYAVDGGMVFTTHDCPDGCVTPLKDIAVEPAATVFRGMLWFSADPQVQEMRTGGKPKGNPRLMVACFYPVGDPRHAKTQWHVFYRPVKAIAATVSA